MPTCSTFGACLRNLQLLSLDASILSHRDLLTSFNQVSPEDAQSIRGCIRELDRKVSQLDRLLDDMEMAREIAISHLAEYSSLAKAYRVVLSPLRDFPAELLEEIFLLCVTSCSNTLSPDGPPWVFGKVCRRWRSVALSAPRLWNVIPRLTESKVHPPLFSIFLSAQQLWASAPGLAAWTESKFCPQLLSTSLRLSRALPLSLEFYLHSRNENGPAYPIIDIFSPHLHRCQSLTISTSATCFPLLDQAFRGVICSLRCLTIRLMGLDEDFADYHSLSAFQLSPNIRELHIDLSPYYNSRVIVDNGPFVHSWLKIMWNNLTTFSGVRLQMQYVTDLLHNAPSLIKCSFIELMSIGTSHFTTVDHTSLRSLCLSVDQYSFFSPGLLDSLTLPSLAELSIALESGITLGSLTSFILRSSCPLSILTLTEEPPDDMAPLLASLINTPLIEFNLKFDLGIGPAYLEPLIEPLLDGKLTVFPDLQHITIKCPYEMGGIQGSSKFVNQLIESRLHLAKKLGTKPLETVTLICLNDSQATVIFNELEGWSENPPQHSQVTYAKVKSWFRVIRNIPELSTPLREEEEASIHDVILDIEVCGTLKIPPMFIHRSTICYDLPFFTELSDDCFKKGDQHHLRQRASIILESWMAMLEEYLACPGWSIWENDTYEFVVVYSTAGRDYYTYPP